MNTSRLTLLRSSLEKKEKILNERFESHFDSVKSANGQPLNDKRNGVATLARWDKQNDAIRRQQESIEKTKAAIDREELKIAHVQSVELPAAIQKQIEAGVLNQWRRHPNTFFVKGVDCGRIVWDAETRTLKHRYLAKIPKDQYPKFRDTFNSLRRDLAENHKPE